MKKINKKCTICNNNIDEYAYYVDDNEQYYCCIECAEKAIYDEKYEKNIWDIRFCPAYEECNQLNNLRKMCKFKNNISKKDPSWNLITQKNYPNWCSPAESSQIISNMKLYNFVKKSEETSTQLNEESFYQNKTTKNLTWIMTAVSIVNLILICIQIILQLT